MCIIKEHGSIFLTNYSKKIAYSNFIRSIKLE